MSLESVQQTEELRSKHIRVLETLDKVVKENQQLKSKLQNKSGVDQDLTYILTQQQLKIQSLVHSFDQQIVSFVNSIEQLGTRLIQAEKNVKSSILKNKKIVSRASYILNAEKNRIKQSKASNENTNNALVMQLDEYKSELQRVRKERDEALQSQMEIKAAQNQEKEEPKAPPKPQRTKKKCKNQKSSDMVLYRRIKQLEEELDESKNKINILQRQIHERRAVSASPTFVPAVIEESRLIREQNRWMNLQLKEIKSSQRKILAISRSKLPKLS